MFKLTRRFFFIFLLVFILSSTTTAEIKNIYYIPFGSSKTYSIKKMEENGWKKNNIKNEVIYFKNRNGTYKGIETKEIKFYFYKDKLYRSAICYNKTTQNINDVIKVFDEIIRKNNLQLEKKSKNYSIAYTEDKKYSVSYSINEYVYLKFTDEYNNPENISEKRAAFSKEKISFSTEPQYLTFNIAGETYNKWVILSGFNEYNDVGNLIYSIQDNGLETVYDYNSDQKLSHIKRADGYEFWLEYNQTGNEILLKDSKGYKRKYDYNNNVFLERIVNNSSAIYELNDLTSLGKVTDIHEIKGKDGRLFYTEYNNVGTWYNEFGDVYKMKLPEGEIVYFDIFGNETKKIESNGSINISEYNQIGQQIYHKYNDIETWWDKYGHNYSCKTLRNGQMWFNEESQVLHNKKFLNDLCIYENWYEYDHNNNLVHYKDSEGYEEWYTYTSFDTLQEFRNTLNDQNNNQYNSLGQITYYKKNSGFERFFEYNDEGYLIHEKNSDGIEVWYEYNIAENVVVANYSSGNTIFKKYNNDNQLIYKKNQQYESWYNTDGNCIKEISSFGTIIYEYDGEKLKYKKNQYTLDSYFEDWYDKKEHLIRHYDTSNGNKYYSYYSDNKIQSIRFDNGFELIFDNEGNIVFYKNMDGISFSIEIDNISDIRYLKSSNGIEQWFTLDGTLLHSKLNTGYETWFDTNGNLLRSKDKSGKDVIYVYSQNNIGNLIQYIYVSKE